MMIELKKWPTDADWAWCKECYTLSLFAER
nr:MAG TPA: hypothetical protein [Caudoviricetes sp.]